MKRAFTTSSLVLAALMLVAIGCRSGGDLSQAETQRQFGVRMAKMNLWREAMFRFQRAVEMEPDNAMARNNLAVAYEATGDYDAAAREYREALRLDRANEHIQRNYSRYVEFTQRSRRREEAAAAASAARQSSADAAPASPADEATAVSATAAAPPAAPPPTDTSATSPSPETATAPPPPPGYPYIGGLL